MLVPSYIYIIIELFWKTFNHTFGLSERWLLEGGSTAFSYLTEVVLIYHFRLNSNPDLRLGDVTTVNWTVTEVQIMLIFFFFMVIFAGIA